MFLSGKNQNSQSPNPKSETSKGIHKTYKMKFSGGFQSGVEVSHFISKIAHAFKSNPIIRNLSIKIVNSAPSHDHLTEYKLLYEWVRDNIRYISDINTVETLQIPTVTIPEKFSMLGVGAGDCDDHVILLATMLLSIGAKDIYARIVSYKPTDKEWKHIYLVIKYQGKEYIMDAIAKNKQFNWEVPHLNQQDIKLG